MKPLTELQGILVEKDLELKIQACNAIFLEYAGFTSQDEAIGLTDYDLPWNEYADLYKAHELDALADRNYSAILPSKNSLGDLSLFLYTKTQKKNSKNQCIGLLSYAVEVINPDVSHLTAFLNRNSLNHQETMEKIVNEVTLSKRQQEVLFLLVRGKSAKMIAKTLNLSHRTIEYYIEIIKNKYQCGTRNELIEFAINHGLCQNIHGCTYTLPPIKKFSA